MLSRNPRERGETPDVYRRRLERLALQGDALARAELDATYQRAHGQRPRPVVAMVRLRSGAFSRAPLGGVWIPRLMPGVASTPAGALRVLTGARQYGAREGSGLQATGPPALRATPEVERGPAWLVPAWFPPSDDPVAAWASGRTMRREERWLIAAWRFVAATGQDQEDAWNALAILSHWSLPGQHYTPVGLVYGFVPAWAPGGAHALERTARDLTRRLGLLGFGRFGRRR